MHNSFYFNIINISCIRKFFLTLINRDEFDFVNMDISIGRDVLEYKTNIDLQKIDKAQAEGLFSIIIRNSIGGSVSWSLQRNRTILIGINEKGDQIFDYFIKNFSFSQLKYASRELSDFFILSTPNAPQKIFWKICNIPIPSPMVFIPVPTFSDPDATELSYEHIPGHTHFMKDTSSDELTFGACWQMYFGEIYYKYIPKPIFDRFTDCYESTILEHGIRRITLYKDPHSFGTPEAVSKQWTFRRQLGIDSIAHEITLDRNRIEPADLPVIITKKNCEKGVTKTILFLDNSNHLVAPCNAVKKEIKEYLDDGVTVVYEKTEILT